MKKLILIFMSILILTGGYAEQIPYPYVIYSSSPPTEKNALWVRSKDHHVFEFRQDRGTWISVSAWTGWVAFNGGFVNSSSSPRFGQAITFTETVDLGYTMPQDAFIEKMWITSEGDSPTWRFFLGETISGTFAHQDTIAINSSDFNEDANFTADNAGWWSGLNVSVDSLNIFTIDPNDADGDDNDNIEDFAIFFDVRFEV